MSEKAKVKIKPKYVAFGILYLAVITVASFFTLDKALDKSQELSQYQIDKTKRFLGEEKAQEMREYIRGEDREDGNEQERSEQE